MAITLDNHVKAETNNSPTVISSPIATTTGALFFAMDAGQGTVGIADSNINAWILGASQNFNGTNGITHCHYVQNATGSGSNTFTGSQSGGAGPFILVASFLGVSTSGGPNVPPQFSEQVAGSGTSVTCPAITPTVSGCLILSVVVGSAAVVVVPTSTNGSVTNGFSTNGDNVAGGLSWFVAGAGGLPYSDTLTFPGISGYDFSTYTFAFAPASGSPNTASIAWTT